MVGTRERMARRPSDAPSKVGLRNQRKLVIDHAGNFNRLPGKFRGGKFCFESCLHCRFAQNGWTIRRNCRHHFAGFIKHHIDRHRTRSPHPSRCFGINRRRKVDRSAVENTTRHWLENRTWSRRRWRFVDSDERHLCVRADRRNSDLGWTRSEFRRRGRSRR